MNGFTKKSVGTLMLGEKLKKLRSDKRISLGEVARFTKIRLEYLEALEESRYDSLPADVYVKGFLRSYADFLGVDENILVKLYKKEKGIKKNLEKGNKPEETGKKPIDISSFVFTPQKIIIAGVILLALTGLFFLYKEVDSFASAPSLVVLSPDSNSEIKGNSVYVKGVTEKDAALFINGQPILVGDDGKFGENLTLQAGLNNISVKSVNKFKKETTQNIVVRSDYTDNFQNGSAPGAMSDSSGAAAADTGQVTGNGTAENIQLNLKVDPGPVWISVETDGNVAFSGTMLSASIQTFKANDKIVISSGRGDATFVTLNGQDMGELSHDSGAVRNVTFTKDTKPVSNLTDSAKNVAIPTTDVKSKKKN